MKIKIEGKEFGLKYGFRTLFAYEGIAGKSFVPNTLMDETILFLASLIATNEDFDMGFDQFVDFLDENPKLFVEMRSWLLKELKKQAFMLGATEEGKKKAKETPSN